MACPGRAEGHWWLYVAGYCECAYCSATKDATYSDTVAPWSLKQTLEYLFRNEKTEGCKSTDEPIDVLSGNNYFTEQRLHIPCPRVSLDLNLKYQSVTTQPEGLLGKDWLHSYEWFLSVEANGATLYTGDGSKFLFLKKEVGYLSPANNNWELDEIVDGYQVKLPGGVSYKFASNGCLESIADAWGVAVTCSYDANNCLDAVVHDNGRRINFSNTWVPALGEWRVDTIAVPNGASLSFSYNSDGVFTQLVEQVGNESFVSRYQYGYGFLTNKVDGAGHEYTFEYESNSEGGFSGKGTGLSVDGYYEHTVNYVDSYITDVAYLTRGQNQIYRYERSNSSDRDFVQSSEHGMMYVADAKQISGEDFASDELKAIYGPASTVQDVQNLGRNFVYVGKDKIEETQFDNAANETRSTYTQYDDSHNVTQLSAAYCSSTPVKLASIQYDYNWKLPSCVFDAEGNRVETVYTNGLPVKVKRFWSDTQSYDLGYGYSASGCLVAVTNANGHVAELTYDAAGNLSTAFAELGPVVSNGYNSLGFVTRVELLSESGASSGRITQLERDAKGRVLKTTYADGLTASNAYNSLGYVTNSTDRAGHVTKYAYALSAELMSVTRYLTESGSNIPVCIAYDFDEQLNTLRITEPRGRYVESYRLDIQDRITAVTNIEGQTMTVDYGVGDFVKKITRFDGSKIATGYDTAGRKSSDIWYSAYDAPISTNSYTYWLDGQIKTVSDGFSVVSNAYDRLNRLTNTVTTTGNLQASIANEYDPVGNLTDSVVNFGGSCSVAAAYQYDQAERLSEIFATAGIEAQRFVYKYSPLNGRVSSVTNSESGIVTAYAYDIMDRATNISYRTSTGSLLRSLDYQYDALGMITNVATGDGSQVTAKSYQYDTINRLVKEAADGSVIEYQYDLAGNRTAVINNGITSTYTLGAGDRLASVTGTSGSMIFSYDAAGNTTNITTGSGAKTLVWNEKYQLTSVTSATSSVSYSYDVLGRRTGRAAGTSAERYIYNGDQVVADLSTNGTLMRTYTWGPGIDNVLSMTVHGSVTNTYYALKDQQNSVMSLVDASGNVVESYAYDAYGRTKMFDSNGSELTQSAVGNRYMWQGREFDTATGLYFFRARWYSPETGRWLSKDPIRIGGGLNLYVFCANNPVNFNDPIGAVPAKSETVTQERIAQLEEIRNNVSNSSTMWPPLVDAAQNLNGIVYKNTDLFDTPEGPATAFYNRTTGQIEVGSTFWLTDGSSKYFPQFLQGVMIHELLHGAWRGHLPGTDSHTDFLFENVVMNELRKYRKEHPCGN